jgi:hypothetical protein
LRNTRLLVVAAVVVAAAAAVGAIGALTRDDTKRAFVLPKCARPAHRVVPPSPYPRSLPVPKGTTYSTVARYPSVIVVAGRTPLELIPATRYLVRELPRRGFRLGTGESEPGLEAEAGFAGHGIVGRFKVRELPACRGAVLLVMSISRGVPVASPQPLPHHSALPACAGAGKSVASGLPVSFPLPAHTLVRSSRRLTIKDRSIRLIGAVTSGSVGDAAAFLLHRLPKAGYRLTHADREATEAEASFAGHGVEGRMRFHTLLGCDGVLTIDVATSPR